MRSQVIIAGGVIATFLLFAHAQQPSTAQRRPGNTAEWEYKAVSFDTGEGEASNRLNALTADGWQYVGPLANGLVAFRRTSAEKAPKGTGRAQPREQAKNGSGGGEAEPRPAAKLSKGAITIDLPDEPVRFHYVEQDGEGLVEVATKGLILRLRRVYIRDGDNVMGFEVAKGKDRLLATIAPNVQTGWYFDNLTWSAGTYVVPGAKDGGFGLIRPGDVVVTSPRFKIETSPPK
jgi:hypothetical protein